MKITNKHNYPESLYKALSHDTYSKGHSDISVTSLIKSPREVELLRRYADYLEEDACDRVWTLLGKSVHYVLEQAASDGDIAEQRIYMDVCGWTISGQTDLYEKNGVISDYKVTSVYSFLLGEKAEWGQQLNLNAMLYRHIGHEVKEIQIVAILRDWQKRKAIFDADYPQSACLIKKFPMWTQEKCIEFAEQRVKLHQSAREKEEPNLPLCSDKERWCTETTYAVKKVNNKRAIKLFSKEEEAKEYIKQLDKSHWIEARKGENMKCDAYCLAAQWCSQKKLNQQ